MKNVKNYIFPADAGEALKMLLDKKLKSSLIAGGTLAVKSIPETVETLVDISRLEKYVKMSGKNLVLGAFETFDRLENSRLAGNWAGGVISKAASKCSSQLIRNMATVGGNIARPNAFNVLPPVFTALDAVVRVETGTGQKNF
ncbi:MAG: FAD binding domain-containing protein, partial [Elusimicrobia bacterium]|nr:FAD binding domain-containing protein [Elusimicrobiota bacterium]